MYKRQVVYVSVLMEFFEYAIDPAVLDHWGGILCDIHGRIKRWAIYNDGNLVYSKVATVLLICITCIGTRAKKHLEFNARRQVLYPLVSGFALLVLSVWLFGHPMETRFYTLPLNIILYICLLYTSRQEKEKDLAAETADAKRREQEALAELEKALAEARLRGQREVMPSETDSTATAAPPDTIVQAKGTIDEESRSVKAPSETDKASEVVKKVKTTSDYFNTLAKDAREPKLIKAIIDEDIKAVDGSRVRLRLLDDIEINEMCIRDRYKELNVDLDRYTRAFDVIDVMYQSLRTVLNVKSTYTAVSDRIGDYKRLLEDFNDRIVKRGRIDPGDAVILAINEKAIRDIADDGKQLYKSVSDLVLYATGAAECSTSDLLMVLEAVNTSLDDIERHLNRAYIETRCV